MRAIATTFTGLEDVASAEVTSLVGKRAEPDVSKVIVDCDMRDLVKLVLASRGINKVFLELLSSNVNGLLEISSVVRSIDLKEVVFPDQTFAVRAIRVGNHDFTSLDIASAVGGAIIQSYLNDTGVRLKVDLRNPDVEFYAFLRDDRFTLGVNLVGRSLQKRFYRVAHLRTALPATLAYLMVRCSGWSSDVALIDPFCGSCTIPIEAGLAGLNVCPTVYRDSRDLALTKLRTVNREVVESVRSELVRSERRETELRILGSDVSSRALEAARRNVDVSGLSEKVRLARVDAQNFENWPGCRELGDDACVVTDPPFGIRSGPPDPSGFYVRAFSSIRRGLGGGTLVAVFSKQAVAMKSLEEAGWTVSESRKVKYGHLEVLLVKATA
ncbi:MAG: THUMP domain-containing protein [Thaumarchaeota archaeon]|nr:THUMP domain-containing protein [Candidatus Calditenuaceae archaeon]